MTALKIATFNINNVVRRLPVLERWLQESAPDIVCLQELKTPNERFPARELERLGYRAQWLGQTSWNGVAILSKGGAPVAIRRALPGDPSDQQSRYIEAAVEGLVIGCLYLPNGNPQPGPKFEYKFAWFERLLAHARTLYDSGYPVVLAGDYNVVPTDFDIYNTRSWLRNALLQPKPRAQFARLLEMGWVDALRTRHPDERIYTFWDYFRDHWSRNAGLRIDHVLLNAHVAPALIDAGVDAWVRGLPNASDHAPLWVTIDRRATQSRPAAAKAGKKALPSTKAKTSRKAQAPVKTTRKTTTKANTTTSARPAAKANAKPKRTAKRP